MLIYVDMCCLKRPFDDQTQARIRLETEAVLQLLAMEPERMNFVRSQALRLENSFNPLPERKSRVDTWLGLYPSLQIVDERAMANRIDDLRGIGIKSFDALHLATAEEAGADIFVTVDDRLLTAANRRREKVRMPVVSVLDCLKEFLS